jgi:formylglycine-generating enzyme required for sulfatase activity
MLFQGVLIEALAVEKWREPYRASEEKAEEPEMLAGGGGAPADAGVVPAAGAPRAAGEVIENALGMKLRWIPAGKFVMGESSGIPGPDGLSPGQVNVTLSRGFWMSQYEVTQQEYSELTGSNPSMFPEVGGGYAPVNKPTSPVNKVSWYDALTFCENLTKWERRKRKLPKNWIYTLPTEAQWEYACRAGINAPFSKTEIDEISWHQLNSGNTIHPVGEKKANAWGLHDMIGNVHEWCLDGMTEKLEGGIDPTGPEKADQYAARGATYGSLPSVCRWGRRESYPSFLKSAGIGIRVVLVPEK